MRTGSDNIELNKLIKDLKNKSKETNVEIWRELAKRLEKSSRSRAEVNISSINRNTEEGDFVVVPGKVLGSGRLRHSVEVAAWDFSGSAKRKINENGETYSIRDLIEVKPSGSDLIIME